MNEIVKFKSDTGVEVEITPKDVTQYICPKATQKEVGMFLELCRAQHLNPFVKDAYLVKYGDAPAQMITGKEVFTKRANANPNFEGMEHGIVYMSNRGEVCKREGAAVYKAAKETLLGGWARVFVKGKKPVYCELALDEYTTGKSNWAKMPAVMINKCAQVGALRLAFPSDFQGLYAAEEMGNGGEKVLQDDAKPISKPAASEKVNYDTGEIIDVPVFEELATDEQVAQIDKRVILLSSARGIEPAEVLKKAYAVKRVKDSGAVQGEEITLEQANIIIELLDKWISQLDGVEDTEKL